MISLAYIFTIGKALVKILFGRKIFICGFQNFLWLFLRLLGVSEQGDMQKKVSKGWCKESMILLRFILRFLMFSGVWSAVTPGRYILGLFTIEKKEGRTLKPRLVYKDSVLSSIAKDGVSGQFFVLLNLNVFALLLLYLT